MKPETKFDFAKIQAAILGYEAAFDAFETAYVELKEYTEAAKERLRERRERGHARAHELELQLAGSPSQMLRDVEAKIKLRREKLNANWIRYDIGQQRAIEELEAKKAHLLEEISRTPSTPEERELKALQSFNYTLTVDDKERIECLYNVAMSAYKELCLAKERIFGDLKGAIKAMENYRAEISRTPLLAMGRDYVDGIKKDSDALCGEE